MTVAKPRGLVGARVRRIEDPRLLTGRGRFIDDIRLPGMLHAAVLRSPHAHAHIRKIDTSRAAALPGVFAVLTGRDLTGISPMPCVWRPGAVRVPETYPLAIDRVRYVGEGVAAVAAVDRYVAEDALDLITVDYEPLPVVTDVEQALAPGATVLYDGWPDNIYGSASQTVGDPDGAFAEAEVLARERFRVGRQTGAPLETRGCIATWDRVTDTLDVWSSTQAHNQIRDWLGEVLRLPLHRIRVRMPDVGGGFGPKFHLYAEEVLTALLSREAERPVKFIEDRRESFMATVHAREQVLEVELAARRDGTILGLKGKVYGDVGAHLHTMGMGPVWAASLMLVGGYRIKNVRIEAIGVATNKVPYGSYRGWGQPKANFALERMVDLLALQLGMEPNEVRRRNLIRSDEFPYQGMRYTYDSGNYHELLGLTEARVAELGWPELKVRARAEGRAVGVGYAFYVEATAFGPSRIVNQAGLQQSGFDTAVVRMDPSGRVTVLTGLAPMGQGLQTALTQVCADALGVPLDHVTVVVGDTDSCPYTAYGTGASRGAALGGATVRMAAEELRTKILRIAGTMLEADPADLTIDAGRISPRGAPGRFVTTEQVGYAAYRALYKNLPLDMEPTLEVRKVFDPPARAFAYGCTAILAEVDRETGQVSLLGYLMADDCGTMINPMIVEGQLHGGAAQGLAGALYEELVYDGRGQLLTGTLADYLIPTACEVPPFEIIHTETPSPVIPGGVKGVGEAGCISAAPAIVNAICDALREENIQLTRIPVTPPRLLDALKAARQARTGGAP